MWPDPQFSYAKGPPTLSVDQRIRIESLREAVKFAPILREEELLDLAHEFETYIREGRTF